MSKSQITTLRVGKIETLTEEQFAIRELTQRIEKLEKEVEELRNPKLITINPTPRQKETLAQIIERIKGEQE